MEKLTIAIAGCTGRMGCALVAAAHSNKAVSLVAGSVRAHEHQHAAKLFVTTDPAVLAEKAAAIIDFTSPKATLANAKEVAKTGGILVVGTTGFSASEQKELEGYAQKCRIVQSGNFSIGVNLLESLVERAAKILGEQYDIEIAEMHHRHKKDAPSGTALMLGRAAAKGRGVSLDDKKILDRDGERKAGDIGFSVLRGGDVVGIHNVLFAGGGELITLSHQGFSREIYAQGATTAAIWAQNKTNGLYSMRDVMS